MILPLKAVIFDMDGIITDTMPYHFRAWRSVFKTQGINVTHLDIYSREGQKGIDSVYEIFRAHRLIATLQQAQQLLKLKEELFKSIFKRKYISGSRSMIKSLHRQRISLALVTGTSRHEARRLLPNEIWGCFDVTVCGCDVKNGKPHPEPYLHALAQLGIKATDALVFENAPFGIRSAKQAKLRCFALETSLPKKYLKNADRVFASFQEVKTKIHITKK